MKKVRSTWMVVIALSLLANCGTARAQTKEVTVPYLRAAVGSLDNRARVVLRAEYNATTGLREVTQIFLRGKGYSRFQVTDPETGLAFDDIYCMQDSKAFGKLLKTTKNTVFLFTGYRGRGERKEPAVIVTDVREVRTYGDADSKDSEPLPEPPKKFQLTVTDRVSSNTTIITNVELGKPYSILGSTLVIEEQPRDAGFITVEP